MANLLRDATSPYLLQQVDAGAALPRGHPAFGKTSRDGRSTAYVCVGTSCTVLVTDPAGLRAKLEAPALRGRRIGAN